jgi:mitochondrial fission protein ELM1
MSKKAKKKVAAIRAEIAATLAKLEACRDADRQRAAAQMQAIEKQKATMIRNMVAVGVGANGHKIDWKEIAKNEARQHILERNRI